MFDHVYGVVPAKYVLNLLENNITNFIYDGANVSINGLKFKLFKTKGTSCLHCSAKGEFFVIFKNSSKYYINLYTSNGTLITKDHILPKSRGGTTTLRNLQPLCIKCNMSKSNSYEK